MRRRKNVKEQKKKSLHKQQHRGTMVRLHAQAFADATMQMCKYSGLRRTRLMLKIRPGGKTITLKSTDDKTTLTARVADATELKIVEQLVNEYVAACTKNAPVDVDNGDSSASGAKKGKGKKGKK